MWFRLICYSLLFTITKTTTGFLDFNPSDFLMMKVDISDTNFYILIGILISVELFIFTKIGKITLCSFYKAVNLVRLVGILSLIGVATWARGQGIEKAKETLIDNCGIYDTNTLCEAGRTVLVGISNMFSMFS
jgi:hypothetical protein